jgi:hypothetical protein
MAKVEKEKLMEGLAFGSEEEKKAFESLLSNEKNLETMSERYMMRSDYSRQSDEARRAKESAEARERDAEAYRQTVAEYEQSVLGDLDAKEKYEAYLKTIGVDASKALAGIGQEAPKPQSPTFDAEAMKKEFAKEFMPAAQVGQLGNLLLDTQFGLTELVAEHIRLFGVPPPNLEEVRLEFLSKDNKRGLKEIGAEKFHFAERQKEIADKTLAEEIDRRVQETLTAERSKQGLPAPVEDVPQSIVFEDKFAEGAAQSDHDRNRAMIDAALTADRELAQQGIRITP